ncbi:MAG TPA: right-handed parallel beta-helix repeat-containing protein [Verrucomicrobiae bacterium]|nr:right-handed parallel beta-helix repeat-containing protein [Verrucomicrobiae bacterium]
MTTQFFDEVAATRLAAVSAALVVSLATTRLYGAEFYNDWATNHLSSVPSQSGPTDDPDSDGTPNLAEYAFGTDPLHSDSIGGAIRPLPPESNGVFRVEIFERAGHRPGVQIDLDATADLTHWIRPWWLRTLTNSLADDPTNSVRELFTTWMPDTNIFFVRGVIKLFDAGPEMANYYVATNGSDSASGTATNVPFRSVHKAVSVSSAGNLIYVRGGTYATNAVLTIGTSHNGTASNPIRLCAYPGEYPVLDFSSQTFTSSNDGVKLQASWWQIRGLEIAGAGHNGFHISGNSNVVEQCVVHDCRDSGIQISPSGSSNLILNCDSYRNHDPDNYEDADGFAAKDSPPSHIGQWNVFHGCRSWENCDDGWDLWQATNTVVIENCWSWRNGIDFWGAGTNFNGDGNGFKLGGNYYPGAHVVVGCVSFGNVQTGFDQNNNAAGLTLDQNTAWANGARNFSLNHGTNTTPHLVRNNLSIAGGIADAFRADSILISNSWQVVSPAASTNDLLSVDTSFAVAPRRDDGGLPETPFLRPVPGGRLVDKGADLGAPFSGSAPDLGAFETVAW